MPARDSRPEVLAPAGDESCLRAAIRSGADAVYFGVRGFNARARAVNFEARRLSSIMDEIHSHGVKGYLTLNTLVFEHELEGIESAIRAAAEAGADAIIVQDLGVARLAREIAPELPIHASTQMTCTDASSVRLAAELGATRVVLARELSLQEIERIRSETEIELEVFVHGALCVSYSGQCLTSEAIGGRSANRGACAQACRLPYELIVDGTVRDLGDRAYLLSPEDLEASALVPRLVEIGVSGLKIEGRLKGPEYVAAATRLYRAAVDAAYGAPRPSPDLRRSALLTYSRGSGPGFLGGVDHQRLVEAKTCEHRGLLVGRTAGVTHVRGRAHVRVALEEGLVRGDGLMIEGAFASEGEIGGRVWTIETHGNEASIWLGPDRDVSNVAPGRRVFKTDDPLVDRNILASIDREPYREAIDVVVRGTLGAPFEIDAKSRRGLDATVTGDAEVARAKAHPISSEAVREKIARLGDSPFVLGEFRVELPEGAIIPISSLNRARRALVDALVKSAKRSHPTSDRHAIDVVRSIDFGDRPAPPAGLFVLCRNEAQAEAALAAGADGVYLDFLDLVGTSRSLTKLRASGARFVGVAPPRIRKPGEEKIDRHLASLEPDAILVRGLGALREIGAHEGRRPMFIGDFSLNVTNTITAYEVMRRGLDAFTPSFDLDSEQLSALLATTAGRYAELVVHHPMPLFHTEHCVFAALLSDGADYRTCGRPCERHAVSLRDRAGMEHPIEADVGCRNTVFHAHAQSAASELLNAQKAGAARFRIELVRSNADETRSIVRAYRSLIDGEIAPGEVFRALRAPGGYGVVRGSLRVLA
jgi:U32 family peptidase